MTKFDAQELFHLGMKASKENDQDTAISYYKQSIELEPKAETRYLLAAEYASLGMYERAIEVMKQATQENPQLWTAYIQIGMLYLVTGNPSEVHPSVAPLLALPDDDNALKLFAQGLSAVADNNAPAAVQFLEQGILLNKENAPLNGDMQQLIQQIKPDNNDDAGPDIQEEGLDDATSQFLISKYGKTKQ